MMDVTIQNFEAEVIEASMTTPVLVDFWAPWCGPCKSLGPVLEKVELAYEGRFKLVKINSDEEQQLASAFGIKSIPTCVLLMNGQPVDGFMGALPEGQVKQFLDKHLPAAGTLQAPALAEETPGEHEAVEPPSPRAALEQALATDPGNDDARFDLVKLLIGQGELAEAAALLAPAMSRIPVPLRFEAQTQWLNALEFVTTDPRGQWALDKFDALIGQNKRDFEARFAKSRLLIAVGEWEAAMEELLEIIMRDKKWDDEAPRKTFVALLELMTPQKSQAQDATGKSAGGIELMGKSAVEEDPLLAMISSYRRKLSMALN
ncbi:thioredoxin [Limnohabitans sp. MMS-10A-160]|uniref:thioredoxin n=1 Tax=unclassified Limnohabitans TaxID=2626134 RepID=UPI000D38F1E1|nr:MULTISPECIES: thioredoxin [unclassified Limnohabitans]PUE20731.1 thioredoxin [Limnohabitans sp. MMS-10A-192]PUE24883.1 thioredoxin [Limnohabitans sp. MMS-10A-160]